MRIMVCGDLHGDASTAGVARFGDVARSLRAAADLAVAERCDGFVQLGDLCDPGPQASRCAALAIEVSARLNAAGIWVRWLVGNHDVVEDGAGASTLEPVRAVAEAAGSLTFLAGVNRLGVWAEPTAEWVFDDVLAVALPHPARGRAYEPSEFIETVEWVLDLHVRRKVDDARLIFVFGHLVVPGMQPGGETLEMPRGREVLFPVAECVARWGERVVMVNGHYHRASRRSQGAVIIPGSLERLTKGEAGNTPSLFVLEV